MLEKYDTILKPAQIEISEKKSRFIASVSPVKNEDEARAFIDGVKKANWNASHNVFAYQIGENNEIMRQSDDGEPAGTAGKPILEMLISRDIKNIVIVVTRYFGGTLLGTGGLLRAYQKAASEGVLAAGIVTLKLYCVLSIICDYNLSGKIQYELLNNQAIIKEINYTEAVEFIVLINKNAENILISKITDITAAKASIKKLFEEYGVFQNGGVNLIE